MNALLQDLQARGLIAQSTDIQELSQLLDQERITLYCGFDPTADSLHIGHLLPILVLRRFQNAGHTPVALVGGATGMIGDPSFKAAERSLNTPETVAGWVESIRNQLKPFLKFDGENPAIMANNADWFGSMNCLDFLRDIGGSDQWGNITWGTETTRRLNGRTVHGMTLPLVTKSDGTKFGKTEGGAVWLDAKKTSPYQFYQFWLKVADADVYKFLKYFTFLSIEQIAQIEADDKASGKKPEAQRILAEEMTRLIHGEAALEAAQRITHSLFSGDESSLTEQDYAQLALDGLPCITVSGSPNVVEVLVKAGLAQSNKEARGFVQSGAVLLNGEAAVENNPDFAPEKPDDKYALTDVHKRFGKYTIIKRGKRNHALLLWE